MWVFIKEKEIICEISNHKGPDRPRKPSTVDGRRKISKHLSNSSEALFRREVWMWLLSAEHFTNRTTEDTLQDSNHLLGAKTGQPGYMLIRSTQKTLKCFGKRSCGQMIHLFQRGQKELLKIESSSIHLWNMMGALLFGHIICSSSTKCLHTHWMVLHLAARYWSHTYC